VSDRITPALASHTTLRLGGDARRLVVAADRDEVVAAVRDADGPVLVLAGGSNVVVGDDGFDGTVVLVRSQGCTLRPDDDGGVLMTVEAGHEWDDVVAMAVAEGLADIEFLAGIPGSAGGTPIQNVGAYGREMADIMHSVRAYDVAAGEVRTMSAAECRFGFRTSVFKRNSRYVVLDVTFRLRRSALSAPVTYHDLVRALDVAPGDRVPPADVRAAVLAVRSAKGMVLDPGDPDTNSVGSFFENPILSRSAHEALRERARSAVGSEPPAYPYSDGEVKTSAAWLIERAGFHKGFAGSHRGVSISTKHTLALTNRGDGTTRELLGLARDIRDGVLKAFDVELRPECVLVNCSLD
jgi:UDP-N-acetylmuramate dehydrogenase